MSYSGAFKVSVRSGASDGVGQRPNEKPARRRAVLLTKYDRFTYGPEVSRGTRVQARRLRAFQASAS